MDIVELDAPHYFTHGKRTDCRLYFYIQHTLISGQKASECFPQKVKS